MKLVLFAVLLAFMVVGCQSAPKSLRATDLLVDLHASLQPPRGELTESEVDEDLNFTRNALERGYVGWRFVPVDARGRMIKGINEIHGPLTAERLRDRLDEVLLAMPDSHLHARLGGSVSEARLKAGSHGSVGANILENTSEGSPPWKVELTTTGHRRVMVIALKSFPSHEDSVWNGFLESVRKLISKADLAIIDLRGNGGGDDTFGWELAELFYGGPLLHPMNREHERQTPETLAIFTNGYGLRIARLQEAGKPIPDFFYKIYG